MKGNGATLDEYGELRQELRPHYVVSHANGQSGEFWAIWKTPDLVTAWAMRSQLGTMFSEVSFGVEIEPPNQADRIALAAQIASIYAHESDSLHHPQQWCRYYMQLWLDQRRLELSENQRYVLDFLNEIKEPCTLSQIIRGAGGSKATVLKSLAVLTAAQLIRKVGERGGWIRENWLALDPS